MKKIKQLIVISGPTAIGKTTLAIQLAKLYATEIISADSRQFFKEMAIGTAKPNPSELRDIKHHFIDSHSVSEPYNVGKYEQEAIKRIDSLFENKDILILVGGSGLYVDAICKGLDELPEADSSVRTKIEIILETKGIEGLQNLLKELDPEYYSKVDTQNPQRMRRALEVCLSTGEKYSNLRKGKSKTRNFSTLKIALNTSREVLYERINARVDEMMKQGLVQEVESLLPYKHLNALQTVGYKELFDYLEGRTDLATAVDLIKQNTRNFAKRQLTWLKRDLEIKWFESNDLKAITSYINTALH